MSRLRKWSIAFTGVLVIFAGGVATASVLPIGRSGSTTIRQHFTHSIESWWTSNPTWQDVAGAAIPKVSISSAAMIKARFSAESICEGATGTWCSVRMVVIIRQAASTTTVELDPKSGMDFAFDSTGDDWESQAMERTSDYLPPGIHTVQVQATAGAASSFRLDDWTLAAEVVNP